MVPSKTTIREAFIYNFFILGSPIPCEILNIKPKRREKTRESEKLTPDGLRTYNLILLLLTLPHIHLYPHDMARVLLMHLQNTYTIHTALYVSTLPPKNLLLNRPKTDVDQHQQN